MKQKSITDNYGASHRICPSCNKPVLYPHGVFCKGIEYHAECYRTYKIVTLQKCK